MILKTKSLQEVCSKILPAVETTEMSNVVDTLQLKAKDNVLSLAVTNNEYYVEVELDIADGGEFNATVMASLFLKLISQTTTEDIVLKVTDNYLTIKGNGSYKMPLIFDGDKLLELPVIELTNVVKEFDISSDILNSINIYNSKELDKGYVSNPVQKLFYMDENGCITFTTGACVNDFTLPQPVRVLFNKKLVKLFKLFQNCPVHFKMSYEDIGNEITQTRVQFETGDTTITSILNSDDALLGQVPVYAIRNRVTADYPYSVILDKGSLLSAINRISLFTSKSSELNVQLNIKMDFGADEVVIGDINGENTEELKYLNSPSITNYSATIDIMDIKNTIEVCNESSVNISFGDDMAFVISRGNIHNVIPETQLM